MGRPKKTRRIRCKPRCSCYKPQGMSTKPGWVDLNPDELEALKLHDVDLFCQKDAAKKMNISQPTFARIIASAHQKVSQALVKGNQINIK